jgi:UDP-N-acetylglucosamine 2-epimerase
MPEEINRILTDHMSTFLFCPTETAVQNLKKENFRNVVSYGEMGDRCGPALKNAGISNPLVVNVGDVMYDVFLYVSGVADKKSRILQEMKIKSKDYYLLTIHRQESTGDVKKLAEIMAFVNSVAKERTVIFPMHPRTIRIYDSIGKKFGENVRIVEPVGYFDMFSLLKNSIMLMTDSGGMQKEAYWFKLPCITLRDETEWAETIRSGWNVLYKDYKGSHKCSDAVEFNGDGRASQKIVRLLSSI